jgi:hypothetical protein
MRAAVLALGLILPAIPAIAQTQTITPPEAKDHVGQIVTVEGTASEVHHAASGKATFIDMGGRYPSNSFAGVIFSDDLAKFLDVDSASGKVVDVTGRVKLYKGAPEIILNDPAQLKVK